MNEEEGNVQKVKVTENEPIKIVNASIQLEKEATEVVGGKLPLTRNVTSEKESVDDEVKGQEEEEEEEENEEKEGEKTVESYEFLAGGVVEDLHEAFRLFDVENEGFINSKKLFSGLRTLGYSPTEAEVQDLIESVDRDGNGEISWDEFLPIMLKRLNENLIEENAREAFCVFDSDESDIISADDIALLFTRLGHNLTQDQVQQIIDAADLDGDGAVTFEDFLAVFHRKPRDSIRSSKVVTQDE